MNSRSYFLIGGSSHGMELEIPEEMDSVDIPVYSREQKRLIPDTSHVYTRREITTLPESKRFQFAYNAIDDETVASLVDSF